MRYLLIMFFLTLPAILVFSAEKIDINAAPLEDLIKIVHIGEARALELISLRPFSSLDDLARIKGIGEKRVEDIKNQGLAWVADNNGEPAEDGPPPALRITPPEPAEERIQEEKAAEDDGAKNGSAAEEEELAVVGKPASKKLNNLFLSIAAAFTSLFSGGIILILKNKLKSS